MLTRTADYRITLVSRGGHRHEPATRCCSCRSTTTPSPTSRATRPGAETYFQIASPESKRAAGLVYEELVDGLRRLRHRSGSADRDAGAKYRPRTDGSDYYGILRRSAGVPAVLSEAAFISNPAEEALLADPAFQKVEATALADAIVRFVTTDDPGSGFVDPYPRTEPAGPAAARDGCEDPPLG